MMDMITTNMSTFSTNQVKESNSEIISQLGYLSNVVEALHADISELSMKLAPVMKERAIEYPGEKASTGMHMIQNNDSNMSSVACSINEKRESLLTLSNRIRTIYQELDL